MKGFFAFAEDLKLANQRPLFMKLINKKIVMARDIGIHGNLFGGMLMA